MPIRTNRGRAAVYRKLWNWPMQSVRNLMVTLLVPALIVLVVSLLLSSGPSNQAGPIAPSVSVGPSPPSAPATTTSTPLPPPPEALVAAEAWTKAWVHHPPEFTNPQWAAQLASLSTEELLAELSTVDLKNLPSATVTGPAVVTYTSPERSATEVEIPTDGARLRLTLIATPAGWRVSDYLPAR